MRALGLVVVSTVTAVTLGAIALFLAANILPRETVEGVNEDPLAERIAQVAPMVVAAGAAFVALRLARSAQHDHHPSAARRSRHARAWLTASLMLAGLWFTVVAFLV